MKALRFVTPVVLIMLVLGACSSHQFHTTKVIDQDFSHYKTYAWLTPVDSLSKSFFDNDIARANILETANRELAARGLVHDKDNPDLLFRYIAIVNNKSRDVYGHAPYGYSPWGWGYGYPHPWMWRGHIGPYPVGREKFRAGHIILEARDRESNTVIWQARGSGEVRNPEQAINRLPEIVRGVIAEFPVEPMKSKNY